MDFQLKQLAATLDLHWQAAIDLAQLHNDQGIAAEERLAVAIQDAGVSGDFRVRLWDSPSNLESLFESLLNVLDGALQMHLARLDVVVPTYQVATYNEWTADDDDDDDESYSRVTRRGRRSGRRGFRNFAERADYARTRSFARVAEAMWKDLNPESAAAASLVEAAQRVQNYFGRNRSESRQVVHRGPNRVLSQYVPRDHYNAWHLSYDAERLLGGIFQDIRTLLASTSQPDAVTSHCIEAACATLSSRRYESRQRLVIGGGLQLVFFKESIEYIFSAEAFEALQVSLAINLPAQADE